MIYIAQNTGTIPVEQKQPYDKYDMTAHRIQEPFLQNRNNLMKI